MDKLFLQYKKLIDKKAYQVSMKWKYDVDDLKSEGYLIFLESLKKYDESKAKFSTYLTWNLKRLENICRDDKKKQEVVFSIENIDDIGISQEMFIKSINQIDKLSMDARRVLEIVLADPAGKHNKHIHSKMLKRNFAWVRGTWNEIREWLKDGD
ncbi:MAG: sigma factor [Patescibacteria group bacterium]